MWYLIDVDAYRLTIARIGHMPSGCFQETAHDRDSTARKELRSLFAYVRYESESRSNLESFCLQCTRGIDVALRQSDNVYNYTACIQLFSKLSAVEESDRSGNWGEGFERDLIQLHV